MNLPRGYIDGIARLAQVERHTLALLAGDRDRDVAVGLRGSDRRVDGNRDGHSGDQGNGRVQRRRTATVQRWRHGDKSGRGNRRTMVIIIYANKNSRGMRVCSRGRRIRTGRR